MGHSLLAPSAAERWTRCVGALHLSRGVVEPDKEYSASGTVSHMIAASLLTGDTLNASQWLGATCQEGSFKFIIDQDRLDRVQTYIDAVNREPGRLWVEKKLNTSPILGLAGQEGHADAIKLDLDGAVEILGVPHKGVLSVHDFKDGYLQVKAKNNLQGLLYLAAALYEFDLMAEINALRFVIHQPKIHHYDEWTYTRAEIDAVCTVLRPVAKLAYDIYYGAVEFDPAIHLNAGEEQCAWCPVRGSCPARANRIVKLFEPLINRHALDDDTLAQIYMRLDEISGAVNDFRTEALRRAQMGTVIPGFKLVRGKMGKRVWINKTLAESALEGELGAHAFAPREIISPTEAEKLLKKKGYEPLKKLVTQAEGSLTLAPVTDTRDAVKLPEFGIVKPEESLA
jgi:hypothetical protein